MMKLNEYLAKSGTRQSDLARAVGVSKGYMSELVGETKSPSLAIAVAIEKATGGQVSATSLSRPAIQKAS